MSLWKLRWRLARAIAPAPIMQDHLEGADGAFVLIRQKGTIASWRLDRLRMKSWLPRFGPGRPFGFGRSRIVRTFVGTIER